MSRSNLDRVRAAFDSRETGGLELARTGQSPFERFWAADVVMDLGDFDAPGLDRQYRGLEGVRRFWMDWLGPWEDLHMEVEYFEREDCVVAVIDQRQRREHSGIEVTRRYAQLFRFREDRVVYWRLYMNPDDALAAVGIGAEAK